MKTRAGRLLGSVLLVGLLVAVADTPPLYAGVPGPHVADIATFHFYTQGLGGVTLLPAYWHGETTRG